MALYAKLDSAKAFRLLLIHHGKRSDPVRADLQPTRLDMSPPPQYETISYCWGDPTNTNKIFLNKNETSVPASSEAALRCVRLPDRDRVVWIDAVCINQVDLDERAQQVAMMANIYASSNGNLVYLGEADEYTEPAVESIDKITVDIRKRTNNFQITENTPFELDVSIKNFYDDVSCGADEQALIHLFSNSWFRRVWAFQEATLAPSNVCFLGSTRIELLDIVRAAQWIFVHPVTYSIKLLDNLGLFCAADLHNVSDRALGFHYTIRRRSLAAVFNKSRCLLASDPRDRVYGILGIWTGSGRYIQTELLNALVPDYRKSVEDVYNDATRVALLENDHFRPWRNLFHRSDDDLLSDTNPSWVLRLNETYLREQDNQDPTPLRNDFTAYGRRGRLEIKFVDKFVISLYGFSPGEVIDVTRMFTEQAMADHAALRTRTNVAVSKMEKQYVANAINYDHIAQCLLAGENVEREHGTTMDTLDFFVFRRALENDTPIPKLEDCVSATPGYIRAATRFRVGMGLACDYRRVLITNTGQIGLGSQLTRAGDIIVIVNGGGVPLVLRPMGEAYRLVGECYIAGVMEGQAMRKHVEEQRPDIEFRIR